METAVVKIVLVLASLYALIVLLKALLKFRKQCLLFQFLGIDVVHFLKHIDDPKAAKQILKDKYLEKSYLLALRIKRSGLLDKEVSNRILAPCAWKSGFVNVRYLFDCKTVFTLAFPFLKRIPQGGVIFIVEQSYELEGFEICLLELEYAGSIPPLFLLECYSLSQVKQFLLEK